MKDWLKKLAVVLFVFPFGLLIGSQVALIYEANTLKPWQWNDEPIIVNCYGPEMDIGYIRDAVEFWEPYGERAAFIIEDPLEEACKHDQLDGFILLKKAGPNYHPESSTLASTKRRVVMFELRSATIMFNPGSYRLENVFEHELGHAYGFTHIEEVGHIMHPQYEKMGPKFWMP